MQLGDKLPQHYHIEILAKRFWIVDEHDDPIDWLVMPERLNRFTFNTEPITTSTYMKKKYGE